MDAHRELAQVMLAHVVQGLGRIVESIRAAHFDVERPGCHERAESLERVATVVPIVRPERDAET